MLLSHNDDGKTAEEGGHDNKADCNKEIIVLSDVCEHVTLFFVFNATRCIAIETILRPKPAPFGASTNCIGPLPAHTQITGSLVHSMNMFSTHFNVYCANIY